MSNMKESTFKSVFGIHWNNLPSAIKKRYANTPYSNDISKAEGIVDVEFSWLFKILSPFLKLFCILVPYRGKDIPIEVSYISKPNSKAVYFNRTFLFPNKKPYIFNANMLPTKDNEVIEFMNLGIGWKMNYTYDGERVILSHKGYVWRIFGLIIPIPLGIFLGKGYAEEKAISDDEFFLKMGLTHFLFGHLFSCKGKFKVL